RQARCRAHLPVLRSQSRREKARSLRCRIRLGLLLRALLLAPFVRIYDVHNQPVADNVGFVEVHELNAFDPAENSLNVEQPGLRTGAKVNLRDISSDDRL